jgi:galactokinase
VTDPSELATAFEQRYGRPARVYRAPGRVNLIGEHTDYNDGFAMPMALDRSTWVAAAPRRDRALAVASRAYDDSFTIDLDSQPRQPAGSWIDYVRGVAAVLNLERGADLLVASDVPIGAGVSSSAALEIACGYALLDVNDRPVDRAALARAGQRAEHEFVGTRCGLMDQMAACYGRCDHALLLDTRTFDHRLLPLPRSVRVVVGNTMVRHALASGEYNLRRADCEDGVRRLARPGVTALRDVTLSELEDARAAMPDRVFRRCRHVVTENARVLEAVSALAAGDFAAFGRLMAASHDSLRDDYEVSCVELDMMVAVARECEGVHGARMTGGGFGGSIVALVDAAFADHVRERIRAQYAKAAGFEPDVWICCAGGGVERINDFRPAPTL